MRKNNNTEYEYKTEWDYHYDYGYNADPIIELFEELIKNNVYFSLDNRANYDMLTIFKIKLESKTNERFEFLIRDNKSIILNVIDAHNSYKIQKYVLDKNIKESDLFNKYLSTDYLVRIDECDNLKIKGIVEIIKLFKLMYGENYLFKRSDRNNNNIFSIYKKNDIEFKNELKIRKSTYDDSYSISKDNITFYLLFDILEKYNSLNKILSNINKNNDRFVDLPF